MKIFIELPSWLGDSVMASPAIENISNFYHDAEIVLIGSFVAIETLKNHPKVIKSHVLEKNYLSLYRAVKSYGDSDIFFSFRSSFRSKLMKFCISSKRKYQYNKNKFTIGHQVEKYNNFVNDCLNINTAASNLVIYTERHSKVKKNKLLGINPGASYGSAKRWYPREFGEVAFQLSSEYDIIIFGGPGEKDIAKDIESYLVDKGINNYLNLANQTSIKELIAQISLLDLFITGDSGPMHLAAALKVPTVSIFGPTNDNETSQWMNEKSVIVKKNLECQPCMKRSCPLNHHNCMKLIDASEVLIGVNEL